MDNELLRHIEGTDNKFRVRIGIGEPKSQKDLVTSWLSQEFSLSLGNNSQEVIDIAWLGKINQFKNIANILGEKLSHNQLTRSLSGLAKSLGDTVIFNKDISKLTWSSSQRLTFSLPLIFIAYKSSDDVREQIVKLSQCVLPWAKDEISFRQPIGFRSDTSIFVDIGTYMSIPDLVINSVDSVFSKQILVNGAPAYAMCSVNFSSRTAITYEDFKGYLKQTELSEFAAF